MEQGIPFMGSCPDEQVQLASPVILFLGNDDGIGLVRKEFLCPIFDLAELNPKTLHFNLVVLTSAVDDVTVRVDRTEVACFIVLFPVEPGEYLSRLFLVLPVASHDLLPAYP